MRDGRLADADRADFLRFDQPDAEPGFKETRHIDADPRDPNINPFFVSGGILLLQRVRLTDLGAFSLSPS